MDVFPVKGCDERAVQFLHQGMRDLIAFVFQELDFGNLLFHFLVVLEHGHQHLSSLVNVFRLFVKEAVKLLVARYQLHWVSSVSTLEQSIVNEMLRKRKPVVSCFD